MYISVINNAHAREKYLIVDQSEELNVPDIPSGYSLVFQNQYTNDLKVLNDDELKKVFQNNMILYEVVEFNSSFKLNDQDATNFICQTFKNFINKIFRIDNLFNLKHNCPNKIYLTKADFNVYKKDEIDSMIALLQNKLNKITNYFNVLKFEKGYSENKVNLNQELDLLKSNLNEIKNEILRRNL